MEVVGVKLPLREVIAWRGFQKSQSFGGAVMLSVVGQKKMFLSTLFRGKTVLTSRGSQ